MAKAVALDVAPGSWEHALFLYPDVDVSDLPPISALRVKTHTNGMRLFSWFFLVLPDWVARTGLTLKGSTFRQSENEWLLVVRVSTEAIPRVAFISGQNPMDCVRLFQARLERAGRIWYVDKYG